MELSLRRWKPGQLLLGWGAYWAGLVGIGLGPAIRATWRATSLPDGHGSVNAGFDNGVLTYEVIEESVKTWSGTLPFSTAMLWLIGPPLLLWLVWLIVRDRPATRGRSVASVANGGAGALPAGEGPAADFHVRQGERAGVRTPNP